MNYALKDAIYKDIKKETNENKKWVGILLLLLLIINNNFF